MSFQKTTLVNPPTWVGWTTSCTVVQNPAFGKAWQNTVDFTVLALLCGYAVPFVMAIVLNEFRHAQGYLRILVYLPVMLPPVVGGAAVQVLLRPRRRRPVQPDPRASSTCPRSQWLALLATPR